MGFARLACVRATVAKLRPPEPPQSWWEFARQLGYFGLAYVAYRVVRGLVANDGTAAFAHAREVISLERFLHVFIEPAVQRWASQSHTLMAVCGWLYVNAQFTITVGAMLFLYFYRRPTYTVARDTLLLAMGIALVGYALYPTAPPRFLPEWGFVDSVSDATGLHLSQSSALFSDFFNPYAAIPSMHIAFALIIGTPLVRTTRSWVVRLLWLLYPLLIAFVIIATGNHFLLDVVLGVATAGLASSLAKLVARLRPQAAGRLPATSSATG